jgi:hypothetical protein
MTFKNIKNLNNIYIFIIIITLFINCSTYWGYRKKDLQDTVTIGVENPSYGLGIRVSYLPLGFFFMGGESSMGKKDKGEGIGIRGGGVGKYFTNQLLFGFLGGEMFYFGEPLLSEKGEPILEEKIISTASQRDNLKSYNVKYIKIFSDPPRQRQKRNKEKNRELIVKKLIEKNKDPSLLAYLPEKPKKPNGYPSTYPFQIEIFGGIYYSFRLGINFSEILDFLLGFTTYDLLDDDIDSISDPEEKT